MLEKLDGGQTEIVEFLSRNLAGVQDLSVPHSTHTSRQHFCWKKEKTIRKEQDVKPFTLASKPFHCPLIDEASSLQLQEKCLQDLALVCKLDLKDWC